MRINQGVVTFLGIAGMLMTTVVFAQSISESFENNDDTPIEIEVVTTTPSAIYVPTWRDQQVLNAIQDYTNDRVEYGESDELSLVVSRIQQRLQQGSGSADRTFNAQTIFVLGESVEIIFNGIERILLPDPTDNDYAYGTDSADSIEEDLSNVDTMVAQIEKTVLAENAARESGTSIPSAHTSDHGGRFDFLAQYEQTLIGTKGVDSLCTLYFDQIDEVAKVNDFPTSVIIATRYREHSCIFANPSNGRGNFQITSHYYPPGPITRDQFEKQIINFIDFSRAKRARYDNIQVFDEIPVSLAYDQLDLTSIRKQAILYNGVHQGVTLENNVYANQNFEGYLGSRQGRDGIVMTVLKILFWEQDNTQ